MTTARPAGRASLRVDLLVMSVAVAWGATYWVAKDLVAGGAVLAVLGVRMGLTTVLLGAGLLLSRRRVTRSELTVGVTLGVILTAVFAFETFGIAGPSATNAGLIISLTMIFTPVLESVVNRTRLAGIYYVAGVLSILGVALLTAGGEVTTFGLGDWLVLGAAVVRAVHVTMMHRLPRGRPLDSFNLTFVQMAVCGVAFVAASFFTSQSVASFVPRMDAGQVAAMVFLVIVCTVFPFVVQMWAVRRTSPSRVSLLLGTEPVWAALVGVTLAGDRLAPIGWVGLVIVLVSTLGAQRLGSDGPARPGSHPTGPGAETREVGAARPSGG
ncbi:DMT family transporter [Cellulomonas timonensis]|uniref:DMT family transporter n=1 Tax=Cellulomonas timonensis TaxID=1689271 RepID=UPI0009EE203C|nr:DMT family transporter [Cellulomonas timonensis]